MSTPTVEDWDLPSWGRPETSVFKVSRLGVEEEDYFKVFRDFKTPSTNELVSNEALFNARLNQADPKDAYYSCPLYSSLSLKLLNKFNCL